MARLLLALSLVASLAAQAQAQLPRGPLPPLPPPSEPASDASTEPSDPEITPTPTQADPAASVGEEDAYVPEDWISPSELPRELPSELESEIVPAAYPRELVRRPLFLPAGGREASISFAIGREASFETLPWGEIVPSRTLTYGRLDLWGLTSFGEADLYLGAHLIAFEDQQLANGGRGQELPTVQSLYAGARFLAGEETALGVQMLLGDVGADSARYAPTGFIERRVPLSARSAIRLGGGVSFNHQNVRDKYHRETVVRSGSIYGRATVQAQATPELGFQVSATYVQHKHLNDSEVTYPAYRYTTYSASAVISLADNVDLVPYLSTFATWPNDGKLVCLSIAGRWLP